MTHRAPWGVWIAGAVVGCAGASARTSPPVPSSSPVDSASEPASSAAQVPSVLASASAPTRSPLRVGPVALALPEARPEGVSWQPMIRVEMRYGRGVFRFVGLPESVAQSGVFPACPLRASSSACAVMEISTVGASPPDDGWRLQQEIAGAKSSRVKRSGELWTSFSPGRDAVYAFSNATLRLDRINDEGKVSTFLEDEPLKRASSVTVIEAGGALMILQENEGYRETILAELEVVDGKVTRKNSRELALERIDSFRQSAQAIRMGTSTGKKVMLDRPEVVVQPGAKRGAWGLVWVEGIAPPFGWPEGRPFKSKNSCGRASKKSRLLHDRSIEKRLHLTLFEGIREVGDVVLRSTNDLTEVRPLVVKSEPRGVWINGEVYDPKGKRLGGAVRRQPAPRDVVKPFERVVSLAFDQQSKQGLLVARVGQRGPTFVHKETAETVVPSGSAYFFRRFNETGAFVGEPVWLPSGVTPEAGLVRASGAWFAIDPSHKRLWSLDNAVSFALPASKAPKSDSSFEKEPAWGAFSSSEGVWLFRELSGGKRESFVLGSGSFSARPLPFGLSETGDTDGWKPVFSLSGGLPKALLVRSDKEKSAIIEVSSEGGKAPTVLKLGPGWSPGFLSLYDVWGDVAVVTSQDGKEKVRWVGASGERPLTDTYTALLPESAGAWQTTGPVLRGKKGGWALLGVGEAFESSESMEIPDTCSHSVAVGPRAAVVACGEAVAGLEPGLRVGLRRIEAPAGP